MARLRIPLCVSGTQAPGRLRAEAIERGRRLCMVAGYGCAGASACAVGGRGLRMLGATEVSYLVPDRVVDGYGLTPPIARRVKETGAEVMVTVDNGIARDRKSVV